MTEVLVIGDGAAKSGNLSQGEVLRLNTVGDRPNVRLQIKAFRTKLLCDPPDRLDDLLRLAAFIYSADTRVKRGSVKDVFSGNWSRRFRMVLPVWDVEFWSNPDTLEMLAETLRFLTGDEYIFEFVKRSNKTLQQSLLEFEDSSDSEPYADVVIPFSGGIDSLAATIQAVQSGCRPILVSHRSTPKIDTRQKNLVAELRRRFEDWTFHHLSLWVHRANDGRSVEFSQRSRSFLFTSLGVVTSCILDINEVRLCDNGVVSINLPQSGQNIGTFLSRSTHPRYLELAQKLMRVITGRNSLSIRNTLLLKTKKETVEIIATSGHPELLQETVSCGHTEGKTSLQPHCGTCTQCIDRRFATVAAGLAEHDLASRYEKDVFVSALDNGEERTHVENYVRFARQLEDLQNADHFFGVFSELYDCLPEEGDVDNSGQALWELFQRQQRAVNDVLEEKIQEFKRQIRQAKLPKTCLLSLVSSGEHTRDLRARYASRLRELLCKSLPAAFQRTKAVDELHVQDVGESVFIAARESLYREAPQLPFAAVTTKPDFSDLPEGAVPLFVEFKYVKERKRLNKIQTEMTSRVTVYKDQGACILFIVYDPSRSISNDDEFIQAFERHQSVWVGIVR